MTSLMVVSELLGNGVIHGGGGDIEVFLSPDATGTAVEVVTVGQQSGREPRRFRSSTGPDETGRGLAVVDALTDALSIEDHKWAVPRHMPHRCLGR
jgi:anti-sigma regulatory factor (Ser/Thr protein kinase)